MSHRPDQPPRGGTSDHVADSMIGNLVQAGAIQGGVHLESRARPRPVLIDEVAVCLHDGFHPSVRYGCGLVEGE
jgi:hypothetical protein